MDHEYPQTMRIEHPEVDQDPIQSEEPAEEYTVHPLEESPPQDLPVGPEDTPEISVRQEEPVKRPRSKTRNGPVSAKMDPTTPAKSHKSSSLSDSDGNFSQNDIAKLFNQYN